MWHAWERRKKSSLQVFGGKDRKQETTLKTEQQMGGWDQNGSWGVWLEAVE
jgi:hypothetical protein